MRAYVACAAAICSPVHLQQIKNFMDVVRLQKDEFRACFQRELVLDLIERKRSCNIYTTKQEVHGTTLAHICLTQRLYYVFANIAMPAKGFLYRLEIRAKFMQLIW